MTGARRSPAGLVGSILLHAAVIGATLFTFAHKLDITEESPPVVPVDLITIAAKTNLIATVKQRPKQEPKQQEPTPPQPEKTETPPPPQPEPQKREAEPKPAEAPPPPPEPAAAEPAVKPPPPPPRVKPKAEAKAEAPEKKEQFDINNIMALLDKRAPSQRSAPNARVGDRNIKGFGPQTAMTMDLTDSLRSQIQQCWSPPVGAPHPAELVVEFELYLKPDGSVAQPPQLSAESQSAALGDSFTRAAAEAARRAIYTCAPYKLPADRYGQWQDITLTFDPRQMIDQ